MITTGRVRGSGEEMEGGEVGDVTGGEVGGGAMGWVESRGERMRESGWVSCGAGGTGRETGVE